MISIMAQETQRPERETNFLRKLFSGHYSGHLPLPSELASREFGFGVHKKIDFRHKAFASALEFQNYLVREAPLFVSHSIARYKFPGARPMPKKEPQGFDLVFDLDAVPDGHEHNKILCPHCLEKTKADALRLLEDFLLSDFGFSRNEVMVNFSGSKGFHFHVETKAVLELSQASRSQITDYVSASGLDTSKIFLTTYKKKSANSLNVDLESLKGPSSAAHGWHKKIFQEFEQQVSGSEEELASFLKTAGYTSKEAARELDRKNEVLSKIEIPLANDGLYSGGWDALTHLKELSAKIVEKHKVSQQVPTDKTVTYDLSRLIRLPGSLHGDTGMAAKTISNLGEFDAQKDAVAFSMKEKIPVIPEVNVRGSALLGGEEFEFFEKEEFEAPLALAVLLLCKNAAVLKGD